jgi:acyl-CoA thioester hydrolase
MEIKIHYEDTDCGGVVYYANYLRYFERTRTDYMEQRGINLTELNQRGILFMVSSAKVDYKSPAHYGDILVDETTVTKITHATFTFHYKIYEKSTRRLLVEGDTTIVTVDHNKKPLRLSTELIKQLQLAK